jgi:hypothetical protein
MKLKTMSPTTPRRSCACPWKKWSRP